jgi:hypothetical protein
MHRQSGRFFESRNVIFNEGGPENRFKWIVLEPDDTPAENEAEIPPAATPAPKQPSSASDSKSSSKSESEIEELLGKKITLPPPPPDLPITLSYPKCTTHIPVCDDDPCYSTSSYGAHRHPTEHAAVA